MAPADRLRPARTGMAPNLTGTASLTVINHRHIAPVAGIALLTLVCDARERGCPRASALDVAWPRWFQSRACVRTPGLLKSRVEDQWARPDCVVLLPHTCSTITTSPRLAEGSDCRSGTSTCGPGSHGGPQPGVAGSDGLPRGRAAHALRWLSAHSVATAALGRRHDSRRPSHLGAQVHAPLLQSRPLCLVLRPRLDDTHGGLDCGVVVVL